MIEKRLVDIENKIDKVIENQHKLELKLTKRVDRNTLIINAMIWIACVFIVALVGCLL
jgi:hypothetical protein